MDPSRCVLCGANNGCGLAAGKSTCWCFEVKIDPEILEQIPEEAKNDVCLCRACATGPEEPAHG
jgi:hypothetical protein